MEPSQRAYSSGAVARSEELIARAREVVADSQNLRQIVIFQRALDKNTAKK